MAFRRRRRAARARLARRRRRARSRVVAGARSALFLPFARARPDRRRRGARGRLQAGGRRHLPRPRHGGGARPDRAARRWCWPRRRPRSRAASTPSRAATARAALPARFGGRALPDIARDRPAARRAAERGRWLSPPLVAAIAETLAARRAGAAVPQPPRLCAADAVPRLRPPLPVPELLGLAGRAPLPPRARLPPLRPRRAPARGLPRLRQRSTRWSPAGPASSGIAEEVAELFPERAHASCSRRDFPGGVERLRAELEAIAQGRGRHRHRHAARRQGPQFPATDAGRRRRRRSRPRQRRPARRRAHLPAAAAR